MSNQNKFTAILIGLSFFLIIGIVSAQNEEETNENIQTQDLGISGLNILPDSPFYFLKNWSRQIQNFFTFNSLAKAELKEKFADEKLMEIKKLIEKNKNQKIIQRGIENYQKSMEELKIAAERIKEKVQENEEIGKFLDKFVHQQILHQIILEKLESQVPTTTAEKIERAIETHLEKFGEVMNKFENKDEIQKRLEKNLEKTSASTKETVIKIRDGIMEKIQQKNTERNATGTCVTLWDPICGKNGKTYSNSCFSNLAGAEIDYKGKCKEKECQADADCPQPKCDQTGPIAVKCIDMQIKCIEGRCKIISETEIIP